MLLLKKSHCEPIALVATVSCWPPQKATRQSVWVASQINVILMCEENPHFPRQALEEEGGKEDVVMLGRPVEFQHVGQQL